MKKLSLVAAAAVAVLALTGCNNGPQETVDVSYKSFNYRYDVSGSVKTVTSYQKDKKEVTESKTFTATNKSYADVKWSENYNLDTNKGGYEISLNGFSYTYKKFVAFDTTTWESIYEDATAYDASAKVWITKTGDDYFVGHVYDLNTYGKTPSKFAGNEDLQLIKLDEIDPEDDEFTLSYTYTTEDDWYGNADDGKAKYVTTVSLTFTRL